VYKLHAPSSSCECHGEVVQVASGWVDWCMLCKSIVAASEGAQIMIGGKIQPASVLLPSAGGE